jgi:hypothetical protein
MSFQAVIPYWQCCVAIRPKNPRADALGAPGHKRRKGILTPSGNLSI